MGHFWGSFEGNKNVTVQLVSGILNLTRSQKKNALAVNMRKCT
jgi:hypothetical protein